MTSSRMELEVSAPPEEVVRRFASSMNLVKYFLFSLTWWMEKKDFVGIVKGNEIRMRVRHGYSNGYTQLLFAWVQPQNSGSRIRVEFRPVWFVTVLMTVIWYVILIPSMFYVADIVRHILAGGHVHRHIVLAWLIGPGVTLAILLIVEIIGKRLGRRDEETMRRHVQALFKDVQT